jgi:hypothetical protein
VKAVLLLGGVKESLSILSKSIIKLQWFPCNRSTHNAVRCLWVSWRSALGGSTFLMGVIRITFLCTVKLYGEFKTKNSLVKSVLCVTTSTVRCFVRFSNLPHALHFPLTQSNQQNTEHKSNWKTGQATPHLIVSLLPFPIFSLKYRHLLLGMKGCFLVRCGLSTSRNLIYGFSLMHSKYVHDKCGKYDWQK